MTNLFNNTTMPTVNPPTNIFGDKNDDKQKERKRTVRSLELPNNPQITSNSPKDQSLDVNDPNFNFAEFIKQRETYIRQQEQARATQQIHTERVIFHRKNEENRKEIESIKQEIKKLIGMSRDVCTTLIETEKTVLSQTIETGTGIYYKSFFQRIKRLLKIAQKRITESKYWLEIFNQRNQSRSYYWGQVQKSGTRFSQSHERSIVTQTD